MGIHGEIKKNWLQGKYPACFLPNTQQDMVWDTQGRPLVTIVDAMCKLMCLYGTMAVSTTSMFTSDFCRAFINQIITPCIARTAPGGVVVICFDSQARINSQVPSKHNTQRRRTQHADEEPYPVGTTWGPTGGLILPGTTSEVPFCINRIFFTRFLRAALFKAVSNAVAEHVTEDDPVRLIIDRCDDEILDDGMDVPAPHIWAEADSSIVYWAVKMNRLLPAAVIVVDTLDSDFLPTGIHGFEMYGVDTAVDIRWIHYDHAWIRFNKLRVSIRNTLGASLFCNVAIACGTDHYDASIVHDNLSELARFRWVTAYAERHKQRLANMTPNQAFDELVLSVAAIYRRDRMTINPKTGKPLAAVVCTNPADTRFPTTMVCSPQERDAEENPVARQQFVTNWTYWFGSSLGGAHFARYRQGEDKTRFQTIRVELQTPFEDDERTDEYGNVGGTIASITSWLKVFSQTDANEYDKTGHPVYRHNSEDPTKSVWCGSPDASRRLPVEPSTADTVWVYWFTYAYAEYLFVVERQAPFVREFRTPSHIYVSLIWGDSFVRVITGEWTQMGDLLAFIDDRGHEDRKWDIEIGTEARVEAYRPFAAKKGLDRSQAYAFLLAQLLSMVPF